MKILLRIIFTICLFLSPFLLHPALVVAGAVFGILAFRHFFESAVVALALVFLYDVNYDGTVLFRVGLILATVALVVVFDRLKRNFVFFAEHD